jgi:hypothetical protein
MSVLHVRAFSLTELNFDTDLNLRNSSALREMPWCIVIFKITVVENPDNLKRLASPLVGAPYSWSRGHEFDSLARHNLVRQLIVKDPCGQVFYNSMGTYAHVKLRLRSVKNRSSVYNI